MTWGSGDAAAKLREVMARQLEQEMSQKRWVALPHQVPPPGDWLGWLMLAGRGAGKTAAASKYMVDHVHGPPCIPGPTPHWMAIIAPTLGDAATACYSGPSGIRSFDSSAVMSSKVGGLLVTWPNGSQAKMYGARDPDDVERLRAGGNACCEANTLIKTEYGDIPIKDVMVGDRVWTRSGLRRVLRSGMTRSAVRVWKLVTDHGTLIATGDHEVLTDTDTVQIQFLRPNDTILACPTALNMTALDGTSALQDTTRTRDADCFIGTSGRNTLERFHLSITSIISSRTITLPLTLLGLSALHRSSMPRITCNILETRRQRLKQEEQCGQHVSSPRDDVKFVVYPCDHVVCECVEHAIVVDAVKNYSDVANVSHERVSDEYALSVMLYLKPMYAGRHVRVQRAVEESMSRRYDDHVVKHSRNGCGACALSVELGLSDPLSIHEVSPVQARVLRVYETDDVVPVYDLMVEHEHEFFADGILVANCLVWAEELAAWRYMQDAFDQLRFGLRVGSRPRWIATTTPKPRPLIKKLYNGEIRGVVVTHATMYDNPNLPEHIKDALEEAYAGSSLGTQELYGRLVEQDSNALWTRDTLERTRLAVAPPLRAVEVGVDPSGGTGEQGIVVVGRADLNLEDDPKARALKHGYVLHDASVHMQPEGWARTAVTTAIDWEADRIVVETNFGGDQAVALLVNACEKLDVSVPIRTVHASRGKQPRAQPVSAMAVQGRWHMVGHFDELEDQLCTWTLDSGFSPDRMDAMVWPAWSMKLVSTIFRSVGSWGGSQMARRTLGRRRDPPLTTP